MARILVIEDIAENWQLLELLIRKAGHEALHANNAEAGLRMLQSEKVDLAFVDVCLPGMDGIELIHRIRKDEQLSAGRYIAVTALVMDGDRERILSAGFDDYVAKPIDVEAIYESLQALPATGAEN